MSLERTDISKVLLLEVSYRGTSGSLVVERFCSAGTDLEVNGFTYTSDSLLGASLPERTGNAEEGDGRVTLSNRWGFVQDCVSPRAFAPITVRLLEILFDPLQTPLNDVEVMYLASGRFSVADENREGDPGTVEFALKTAKNDTEYPLDNLLVNTCRNRFGDPKTCGFDIVNAGEAGSLTTINGVEVTITGLSTVDVGWWEKGFVEFSGVRVAIRSWDGADSFVLSQLPPQVWVDLLTLGPLAVEVFPGCPGTVAACRRRGRESNFRGLGLFMPYHHPMFERPL